jgi:hypothetical protein
VSFDPTSGRSRSLVSGKLGGVNFDLVGLEVDLRVKDDEFLLETVGSGTHEMLRAEMRFLYGTVGQSVGCLGPRARVTDQMGIVAKVLMSHAPTDTDEALLVAISAMLVQSVRVVKVYSAKLAQRVTGKSRGGGGGGRRVVAVFDVSSELGGSEQAVLVCEYLEVLDAEIAGSEEWMRWGIACNLWTRRTRERGRVRP